MEQPNAASLQAAITLKRIDRLPEMQKKIVQYNELLNSLYHAVGTTWNIGKARNQRSIRSSTEKALDRIEEVRDLRDQVLREYAEELCAVESWLRTVKDQEIEAIIRCRIVGISYKQISQKMYATDNESTPRIRLRRYFKNQNNQKSGDDPSYS